MKRYIFISEGLNKLDVLTKSINEETVYKISNSVSLEELHDCSSIGFIYHSYAIFPFYDIERKNEHSEKYFSNVSSDFWKKIKELKCVVDLITCNLNQEYQIASINDISKEYEIQFRYSLDETGNSSAGGNWILENSTDVLQKNMDIKNLYFNDEINNWDVILDAFSPKIKTYSVSTSNDITLVVDSGIPSYSSTYYSIAIMELYYYANGGWIYTYPISTGTFTGIFNLNISRSYLSFGKKYKIEIILTSNDGYVYKTPEQGLFSFVNFSLSYVSFASNGRDCVKYNVKPTDLYYNTSIDNTSIDISSCGLCYSLVNKIPTVNDDKLEVVGIEFSSNNDIKEFVTGGIEFGKMYYVRFFYQVKQNTDTSPQNTGIYYSPVHIVPTCLKPTVTYDLSNYNVLVSVSINTTEPVEYGFCYSTTSGPTIMNQYRIMQSNVSGPLNSTFELGGLIPYNMYYMKTYVKYGKTSLDTDAYYYSLEDTSFRTEPLIVMGDPVFESNSTAKITTTVRVGENSTIEVGVCWSIYPDPTILFSKESIKNISLKVNTIVPYTITMNSLTNGTYYIRSYVVIDSILYYGKVVKTYKHITSNLEIDLLEPVYDGVITGVNTKCIYNLNLINDQTLTVDSCGIVWNNGINGPLGVINNEVPAKTKFTFDTNTKHEITFPLGINNNSYYLKFYYKQGDKTFYGDTQQIAVFKAPTVNNIYSKSVNVDTKKLNFGNEFGICWSKNSANVTTDFYVKIQSYTTSFSLKSLSPSTTYYVKSYVKINSRFFYSYDTLTFKTLPDTNTSINFLNPTTIFNNKPYIGEYYKLNLSQSNFSNLNLSEYYMGGVFLKGANFDNITTRNILGQPSLSNGYENRYGFILGKKINMINPVITQDMKDIFYNIDLTDSNIINATIVEDCLVDTTVYNNTTFTSTNIIYKNIKNNISFFFKKLVYYNILFPINGDDEIMKIMDPNSKPNTQTFVKTKYGILINNSFLLKWDGSDLSDMDISECPLELFEDTSFKNIGSNANTKLPIGLVIINKYIIGRKMILINVDFNNVVADLSIDLSGIISGGILNYGNITFSNNYRIIKMVQNDTGKFESITIQSGGIIVGPNTNFNGISFYQSDLTNLKLGNVVFDNCDFPECFGKTNTDNTPQFKNCGYEIIGGYVIGPKVSLENANFENNHYMIRVKLTNVSSRNIQNYTNVNFKNNYYQIVNGCIFGPEVIVKNVEFNGETVSADLTGIISTNITGTLQFSQNRYFLLEGFIIGPKVHYEIIKITTDYSKNVLLNILSKQNTNGVAVGSGTNTIAYSYDGITWIGLGKNIFSTCGYGIAYNGELWVAVGEGTNSIAYSSNGFNWNALGTSYMFSGKSVMWNGINWIVIGDDSFGAISNDGITWSRFSIGSLQKGRAITWNGSFWIIAGETAGTGILYSADGTNWNEKETGFICSCYGVVWNGTITVAVGEETIFVEETVVIDGTVLVQYSPRSRGIILYSYNNDDWFATGENLFSTRVNGIAANESGDFVAVGEGTNTIAYSTDGILWTAVSNNIFSVGKSVSWNKKYWVAVGEGKNSIAYSKDGINWFAGGIDVFSSGKNLVWDGIITDSSIYSESDEVNIRNIIYKYDSTVTDGLVKDESDDILITPATFLGVETTASKYYPNFNVDNKLTIMLNDNEYVTVTKLWKKPKNKPINVFYKYAKFKKVLDIFQQDGENVFYDKGQTIKIKKYKIVLQ